MAEVENNKPKTEKTSASVSSTLSRLCPTSKLDFKNVSCNIPKLKKRCQRNRPALNETDHGLKENSIQSIHKSRLTDLKNSSKGFHSNESLPLTLKNYHGQIPVLYRHSLNALRMSPPVTTLPSPIKNKSSPKENKSSNKIKTITFDQDAKKKNKNAVSRSPSPVKKPSATYKKPKQQNGCVLTKAEEKPSFTGSAKQVRSPRSSSPCKRKSKAKVNSSLNISGKAKYKKESQSVMGDADGLLLKQASQPSLCKTEKLVKPKEKISLDHIKNEVYTGDHRRLSFEKVHVCIEKSVENLKSGKSKRSYMVRYSAEDTKNEEEVSLSFLKNLSSSSITEYSTESDKKQVLDEQSAIRTLSGHELILTPSMKIDLEKDVISDDIEISKLLHETGENFEDQKDIHMFQDDANEYDSEVSTDQELARKKDSRKSSNMVLSSKSRSNEMQRRSANSLWKTREADIMNDVDYRQSVYHPAVSRRHKGDGNLDNRPKSKSIENNYGYGNKAGGRIVRSRSSNLKNKYSSQALSMNLDNCNDANRPWDASFDKTDDKHIFTSVIQGVPIYSVRRSRTKKERVSGALLRFTLKIIRLLAIFNIWPGDNCYMLTSQSLKCASAR